MEGDSRETDGLSEMESSGTGIGILDGSGRCLKGWR